MITTIPATTTTVCPPWCGIDHSTEPADHHVGTVEVRADLTLFLAQIPGEGVTAELVGKPGNITEHGAISLSPMDVIRLAAVLGKLSGALVAAMTD
jgi:hypothetical protein